MMPAIIVPQKFETDAVRRGRSHIKRMTNEILELHDRGKEPQRIVISTAVKDDLTAFFDYAYTFDGILPREYCGLPIVHEPGAERLRIECR